jgi:hypothetical protein
VTAYNPAFHAQNWLGNLYQMALGGVRSPKRLLQATVGGFSDAEKSLAKTGGVLNTGQVMESLGENLGDVSKLGKQNVLQKLWGSKYNPAQIMSKIGSGIENNARTAMFNDAYQKAIKSGMDVTKATQEAFSKTNKYLFDYATGLGPREKAVRDVLPFYSWTRFNAPLQTTELLKQPSFFAAQGKLSRTIEPDKQGIPDERGYSLPTPLKSSDGNDVRWSPNLPSNTLFDMTKPGETTMNMVSPAIKDLITLLANIGGSDLGQYGFGGFKGKPIIPPGYSAEGKARAVGEYVKGRIRPFKDIESSAKVGGIAGLLKYLFGGFQSVNPQQNVLNQVYEGTNLRSKQTKEMNDAIKSGDQGYINRLRSQR